MRAGPETDACNQAQEYSSSFGISLAQFYVCMYFIYTHREKCMLICLLDHAVNPCRRNILFHYNLLTANFIIMVILTIAKAIQIAAKIT